MLLLPLMLVMTGGGVWLAYSQYGQVDQAANQLMTMFASDSTEIEYGSFYEIKGLIINPAGSEGTRYLMVNIGFESNESSVLTDLENKEVVVRDHILNILGERTAEELGDISKRDALKKELLRSINKVVEGKVDRLYFTQYVLQ